MAVATALLAVAATAAAQATTEGRLDPFTNPGSSIQRDINALYYGILPVSIIVGVVVLAILFYSIARFRGRPGLVEATEEHERGHTKLEIAWTIPPAAILLIVGLLSTQTLTAIENPPTPAFEVKVIGSQWIWNFEYPDGSTSTNELAVEAGKVVSLNVTATDVIHNFAVPTLGVKIDAIPGRINQYWLRADEPGTYLMQCMEYCAGAHAYMRGQVIALEPGSTERGWRSAEGAGALASCDEAPNATRTIPVAMLESGGNPWSVDPPSLALPSAQEVCFQVINPAGQSAPHNMSIIDTAGNKVAAFDPALQPGREGAFTHTFEPGRYIYYCAVPGHRQLGMEGALTVS